MDSFTITLTGTEPELKCVFFPPIELDGSYVIGLVDFQSYNAIYNVKSPFNELHFYEVQEITVPKGETTIEELNKLFKDVLELKTFKGEILVSSKLKILYHKGFGEKLKNKITIENSIIKIVEDEILYFYNPQLLKSITIEEGTYEVFEIAKEIQKKIPDFVLTANNTTMKATLVSKNYVFDFTKPNLGTKLLGFSGISLPGIPFYSKNKVSINNVNIIRVQCNIADGSYLNGRKSHSIHSFFPQSPPGFKIIEVPKNILYFPVNRRILDVVSITFADQYDRPIDFNGEETTITCHIKKK